MNEDYMFEDEDYKEASSEEAAYVHYEKPEKEGSIGLAVASFVVGLLSLIFFLTGINFLGALGSIILGIIFIAVFKQKRGRGFAIAGIICSVLSIVVGFVAWAFIINNLDNLMVLSDDDEVTQYLYDFYGITEDEYPMLNQNSDAFPFDAGDIDMDDTL